MKKQQYEKASPIIHDLLITRGINESVMDSAILEEKHIEKEGEVISVSNSSGKEYTEFSFYCDKYGSLRPVLKTRSSQIELTISEYAEIENVFKDILIKRIVDLDHNLEAI